MSTKTATYGLSWDIGLDASVEQSQQWVLSAMHSHGGSLVTMLWRILGNEADVCDAYQQTFLNLAHYKDRKKPANVQAYLFRSAANVAISMLRRKKVRQQSIQLIAPNNVAGDSGEYTCDFDAKLLQERLRSAISKLPDYLREVVLLRDLAEMSITPWAGFWDFQRERRVFIDLRQLLFWLK